MPKPKAEAATPARVVELRVSNFARVKAAAIRPGRGLVEITGRNGQGKTTILSAIKALVGGKAQAPTRAIRQGAQEAELYADLGPVRVWRKIKHDKHGGETWDIQVTAGDELVRASPQKVLDAFKGEVGFDPLAFGRMLPRQQFDVLKRLVPDFDFEANAEARAQAFEKRTSVNRQEREHRASAERVQLPDGPKPEPVNVSALLDDLQTANDHNASIERRQQARTTARQSIQVKRDQAEELRARAAGLEKEADDLEAKIAAAGDLPPPADVGPIKAALSAADKIKGMITLFEHREYHEGLAKAAAREAAALTTQIESLDTDKAAAIARAKLPVDGLSLGDGEVLLNGLPIAQAGGAERIEACVEIAMALNPAIKVVLIDEGSELDSDARALVHKMALDRGYDV